MQQRAFGHSNVSLTASASTGIPKVLDGAFFAQKSTKNSSSLNDIVEIGTPAEETPGSARVGQVTPPGDHSFVEATASVDEKYAEYVKRIFRWSVYRSHAGDGQQQLIERKHMDPRLIEMRRLAEYFGDP